MQAVREQCSSMPFRYDLLDDDEKAQLHALEEEAIAAADARVLEAEIMQDDGGLARGRGLQARQQGVADGKMQAVVDSCTEATTAEARGDSSAAAAGESACEGGRAGAKEVGVHLGGCYFQSETVEL